MDDSILNLEQAVDFLGISEKTLIKLLREEHIPARKIGREWRFSRAALTEWLAGGDSMNYINRIDSYNVSQDDQGSCSRLMGSIREKLTLLEQKGDIGSLLPVDRAVGLPSDATLRVSYKQSRDVEKLEFKLYWPMREECCGMGRGMGRTEPAGPENE